MKKEDYGEKLAQELLLRIEESENSEYQFPEAFSTKDYIFLVVFIIICLTGVLMGAGL